MLSNTRTFDSAALTLDTGRISCTLSGLDESVTSKFIRAQSTGFHGSLPLFVFCLPRFISPNLLPWLSAPLSFSLPPPFLPLSLPLRLPLLLPFSPSPFLCHLPFFNLHLYPPWFSYALLEIRVVFAGWQSSNLTRMSRKSTLREIIFSLALALSLSLFSPPPFPPFLTPPSFLPPSTNSEVCGCFCVHEILVPRRRLRLPVRQNVCRVFLVAGRRNATPLHRVNASRMIWREIKLPSHVQIETARREMIAALSSLLLATFLESTEIYRLPDAWA